MYHEATKKMTFVIYLADNTDIRFSVVCNSYLQIHINGVRGRFLHRFDAKISYTIHPIRNRYWAAERYLTCTSASDATDCTIPCT